MGKWFEPQFFVGISGLHSGIVTPATTDELVALSMEVPLGNEYTNGESETRHAGSQDNRHLRSWSKW
jgi:hypothetical protein